MSGDFERVDHAILHGRPPHLSPGAAGKSRHAQEWIETIRYELRPPFVVEVQVVTARQRVHLERQVLKQGPDRRLRAHHALLRQHQADRALQRADEGLRMRPAQAQ